MNRMILDYIEDIKSEYPELFADTSVIEFGCLNINGSARSLFKASNYIGVDAIDAPSVDVKCLCHDYQDDIKYDVVVSTEMLEHDPYWDQSIVKMLNILKDEGSLIITAAGPSRHPHGQKIYTPLPSYYRNMKVSEMTALINRYNFKRIFVENDDNKFLLIFCYWKF
jgi:hypothetical protein